jgi:enoyl-CoA hydratase/carnithine racemase
MSYERLTVERDGPIVRVWLDRPDRLNALDARTLEDVAAFYTDIQEDFDARVVVLGGRGRAFCAGADRKDPPGARMSEASGATERERRWAAQLGRRACRAVEECEVVTVARLHGHVVGGGAALAVACDFRVASEDAQFHVPEVDLGIPLTWGATPRLIQEVGAARARQLIVLCDRVGAAEAERWGLVHQVVAAERLDEAVDELATRLAAKPETAVHMAKSQFLAYARRAALGDVTETDGDLLALASRTGAARGAFGGN